MEFSQCGPREYCWHKETPYEIPLGDGVAKVVDRCMIEHEDVAISAWVRAEGFNLLYVTEFRRRKFHDDVNFLESLWHNNPCEGADQDEEAFWCYTNWTTLEVARKHIDTGEHFELLVTIVNLLKERYVECGLTLEDQATMELRHYARDAWLPKVEV